MNENTTIHAIWSRSSERNLVSSQHWASMADKFKHLDADLSGFAQMMAKQCLAWHEADQKQAQRFYVPETEQEANEAFGVGSPERMP